jgi:hypothetical protein
MVTGSLWSFDVYNVLDQLRLNTCPLVGELLLGRVAAAHDLCRVSLGLRLDEALAVH